MKNSKTGRIAGWVLSCLIAAFLIFASAAPKFIEWDGKAEMFEKFGYSTDLMMRIGIVEIAVALLFLIPRAGFVGAVLLTGYLGGASATHVRVGDDYHLPIIIGILVWVALGLRRPEVFALAFAPPANSLTADNAGQRTEIT